MFWLLLLAAMLAPVRQDDVIPRRYHLEITIDPARDSFEGVVRLDLAVVRRTNSIVLNAKDLTVLDSVLQTADVRSALPHELAGEDLRFRTPAPLEPGDATLTIRYTGQLKDQSLVGAYRKQYNGDWYVFTTFTPIEARRAFPCFDDPHFKSDWELVLHIPDRLRAFANAPSIEEKPERDGMKRVAFASIGPLPSELVAFAVGPFDVLDAGAAGARNTPVRVITPRGLAAQAAYAGEATRLVLPRLERYTGIPYPFPKLDHVALLEGAFGAVENPGLITYRMRSLLSAPAAETEQWTRGLRSLMAHELAHQWFGNLVTQDAWEDVWLSEGFATWLGTKVMDEELPTSSLHVSAVAAREQILSVDAGDRAQPVRKPRSNREELDKVYNRFVYQKGAAVLLMLEGWLGEEKVQEAMRLYLRRHGQGTATTADLAQAIRTATGQDPSSLWPAFLDRTGPPFIEASLECTAGRSSRVTITTATPLPVCIKSEARPDRCALVTSDNPSIDLGATCPAWFYPNAGGTGYYRSRLSATQLESIPLSSLNAAERLTFLYDVAAMLKSPDSSAAAVKVLQSLRQDANPSIAEPARRMQ